jgi:hypothetical protein
MLLVNCKKNNNDPEDPGGPGTNEPGDSITATSISNNLRFLKATKVNGEIPAGPQTSSLKISFEDTLYLANEFKRPIKFLHLDTLKNVGGVYVQVSYRSLQTTASYYYNVPEIQEMKGSDSISVILMGVDADSLKDHFGAVLPLSFDITIVPYDMNGVPIAEITRPAKVEPANTSPTGSCGLVLPDGMFWNWDLTLIEDPNGTDLAFYNDKDKIWGEGGQNIKGCCINGISSYGSACASDPDLQRSLRFPTWFQFEEEFIKFFNDGKFSRFTREIHALPEPEQSNFCGTALGKVSLSLHNVTYDGDWSVSTLANPIKGSAQYLTMVTTAKAGGSGHARTGGVIIQLDCNTLTLLQPDREGFGRDEVSFFYKFDATVENWFDLL